ncbi:hypothetical protein F5Y15DRAFT_396336, partial [Xylariaceae sp. FL0016]
MRSRLDKILTWIDQLNLASFVTTLLLAAVYLWVLIKTGMGETRYVEFFKWSSVTKKRRIFVTQRGYFGLGSWECRVDDEVLLLRGHSVPIVARPGQQYRVVGESHVSGIMYGEAFDEDKCQNIWF